MQTHYMEYIHLQSITKNMTDKTEQNINSTIHHLPDLEEKKNMYYYSFLCSYAEHNIYKKTTVWSFEYS